MPIPKEILAVERPDNTIVVDQGGNGPKRYAVRERKGVKYIPKGNPQPINGPVVGYIINLAFVERKPKSVAQKEPDMLSYGAAALVCSVLDDVRADLLSVYDPNDAFKIMAISCLRVIKPGITNSRLASHYARTFLSVLLPGVALSGNTVSQFLSDLGKSGDQRKEFFRLRSERVDPSHHIAVDGTLKEDGSTDNSLAAFSFKKRPFKELSILFAFDIEAMEPICSQVFQGNCIDAVSYSRFIQTNDIKKGIIIADKGFPVSSISEELKTRPGLHFISPLKRNDGRIGKNDMLRYEGPLNEAGMGVLYKKKQIRVGRWLYSFRDLGLAAVEESVYVERQRRNGTYDAAKHEKKKTQFGVIVFESDQDLEPLIVYLSYKSRWIIEMVFRGYKNDIDLETTRVQGDFSILGSEMINFISTLATCRILARARKADLLKDSTFGNLMDDLNSIWRMRDATSEPRRNDGTFSIITPGGYDLMEKLEMIPPEPKQAPKKRGRKPKAKNP